MKIHLIILLFSIIGTANAQDPALAENTWYFDNGVIDGEAFMLPDYLMAQLEFLPDYSNLGVVHPFCEESMAGTIDNIDMQGFDLIEAGVILIGVCGPPDLGIMEPHYRIYADYPDSEIPFNPFTYEIEDTGGYLQLTITNGKSDIAVYNSILLNTPEFEANQIVFYPNPVKDELNIKNSGLAITKIEIFNLQGSIVFSSIEISSTIALSHLSDGLYLVKATTENGAFYRKIIKE